MRVAVLLAVLLAGGCQDPFGKGFIGPTLNGNAVGAAEGDGDEREERTAAAGSKKTPRNSQTIVVTVPGARPN